jgi:hypothetical protein
MKSNVFEPRSASNRYVIYDQFHWAREDHFVETVVGWKAALERYRWWKEMKGDSVVLGLATKEYFDHLMDSYK